MKGNSKEREGGKGEKYAIPKLLLEVDPLDAEAAHRVAYDALLESLDRLILPHLYNNIFIYYL